MDDALARWAASRAPDLIARAEAEAVAVLRAALVEAASRERRQAPAPASPSHPEPAMTGELSWAYCVVAAEAAPRVATEGVAASAVERVEAAGLAALVSRVPAAQFAAHPLRDNLNDIAWLERVARAHEAVLDEAFAATTIVPLRICTLYEGDDGVRAMLERERAVLVEAIERLDGREEWGVKLIVDPERVTATARATSPQAATFEEELGERTGGGAYILQRRLERHVRECVDALVADVAAQIHARLQDWAIAAVTRPPQSRDLSHHEGEMLLNGAYLVEAGREDELRSLVAELEDRHADLGARIELTGPWPPFNFVDGTGG
jgi:hypothetical protein